MSYFYSILYLAILSTSVFAMDRKAAADRKNSDYTSYNPRNEVYEQTIAPNRTAPSSNDKSSKDTSSKTKYSNAR